MTTTTKRHTRTPRIRLRGQRQRRRRRRHQTRTTSTTCERRNDAFTRRRALIASRVCICAHTHREKYRTTAPPPPPPPVISSTTTKTYVWARVFLPPTQQHLAAVIGNDKHPPHPIPRFLDTFCAPASCMWIYGIYVLLYLCKLCRMVLVCLRRLRTSGGRKADNSGTASVCLHACLCFTCMRIDSVRKSVVVYASPY